MKLQKIETKIYEIRALKVMLDFDLSEMYHVETRVLKQAVNRNKKRFPKDFMFQLSKKEWQEVITNCDNLPDTVKYSPAAPYAFTEQGVSMLSSVLRSNKAIKINIAIMRAFVLVREFALNHKELTKKLKELEIKYDKKFNTIYEAIDYLLKKDKQAIDQKARKLIGFK